MNSPLTVAARSWDVIKIGTKKRKIGRHIFEFLLLWRFEVLVDLLFSDIEFCFESSRRS